MKFSTLHIALFLMMVVASESSASAHIYNDSIMRCLLPDSLLRGLSVDTRVVHVVGHSRNDRYLAVKTNVVPWAAAICNVEGELQLGTKFSLSLPLWYAPWFVSNSHALRVFSVMPEGRYWIRRPGSGHFFGIHANVCWFNLKFGEFRYQDMERPLLGAGISYGYALHLKGAWSLEFTAGIGYATLKYDRFYNIDNGARIDSRSTSYFGIDRIGINIIYKLGN